MTAKGTLCKLLMVVEQMPDDIELIKTNIETFTFIFGIHIHTQILKITKV